MPAQIQQRSVPWTPHEPRQREGNHMIQTVLMFRDSWTRNLLSRTCWAWPVHSVCVWVCVSVCAHVCSICLYVGILNRTTGQDTGSAFTYSEYRKCWQPPVCVFIKGFIRFSVDTCWILSSVAASMPTSVSRSRLKYLSSFWTCALKSYTNDHKQENLIGFAWKIWPNIFIFFSRLEQDV